ncbi:MAG: GlcG protein [Rhodospirillaceae bacterium]|jgi:uncharacterized protein GlcG (DUF336 family)|nr:GlcG protein [Rhodospirillaceae bacterium]MDP6622831.1 heme-binding protein [Alphaproteobacteria bacterium]
MIRPSLEQASTIIEASFAKGLELNAKPLTVAILDQGGQLKALKRQDGSSLLRPEIAMGKAWGALGMGQNSRQLGEVAAERPSFIAAAVAASGGRLVPVPGGVLIREVAEGEICGAVGISGDTSDLDEECAIAGIEAAGLIAG